MGTPLKPLILLLFYLTFVYYGCQYMTQPVKGHQKSKKEGHLFSSVLVMYNLSMAVLNAWISYEVCTGITLQSILLIAHLVVVLWPQTKLQLSMSIGVYEIG